MELSDWFKKRLLEYQTGSNTQTTVNIWSSLIGSKRGY